MKRDAIMLRPEDNVATALRALEAGNLAIVGVHDRHLEILMAQSVSYGHKFATRDIRKGEDILKYGEVIGRATDDIPAGAHAHVQNIESLRGRGDRN
ncbi:UxaA family hydrolase [Desulfocurvus sp. DL9XJH121]